MLLCSAVSPIVAQNPPDVIRGHVRGVDGAPLEGATITATPTDGSARTIRADAQGAYAISVATGDGPYTVVVTAE